MIREASPEVIPTGSPQAIREASAQLIMKAYEEAVRVLGARWWALDNETIVEELPDIATRLLAWKTFYLRDGWMSNPEIFEKIVMGLNTNEIDTSRWEVPHPAFIAAALAIMEKSRPIVLTQPVIAFVRACCEEHGFSIYPAQLSRWQRRRPLKGVSSLRQQQKVADAEVYVKTTLGRV